MGEEYGVMSPDLNVSQLLLDGMRCPNKQGDSCLKKTVSSEIPTWSFVISWYTTQIYVWTLWTCTCEQMGASGKEQIWKLPEEDFFEGQTREMSNPCNLVIHTQTHCIIAQPFIGKVHVNETIASFVVDMASLLNKLFL